MDTQAESPIPVVMFGLLREVNEGRLSVTMLGEYDLYTAKAKHPWFNSRANTCCAMGLWRRMP